MPTHQLEKDNIILKMVKYSNEHITIKEVKMVNILKKRDSILLVIKEMQIKATMRFYYKPISKVKKFFVFFFKSGRTRHWLGCSARNSLTLLMGV